MTGFDRRLLADVLSCYVIARGTDWLPVESLVRHLLCGPHDEWRKTNLDTRMLCTKMRALGVGRPTKRIYLGTKRSGFELAAIIAIEKTRSAK